MRSTLLTAALCSIPAFLAAQPTFQWAASVPNVSTPGQLAYVVDLDVAPDGSAYVTGMVNGPRAIVGDNIVGGGYVARYDTSGNCLWAKTSFGTRVAVNGSNGAYVVGTFYGSMVFAGNTMTASGQDAFVAKYDANGLELWARQMGGALNDLALSLAVDGLGRVHVGGIFRGTASFGGTTLTATQDTTGFHATYDASGNFEWAVIAGGFNSNDGTGILNTMACDALGNTIMAGNFDDTGTYGTTTTTATAFDKLYLPRFDVNGNCSWAYAMGATFGNEPTQVAIAPSGNIYLYGGFWGASAVFGSTTLNNSDVSHKDIFLALFDANGSAQWAQKVDGSFFNDFPSSLDVDDTGNAWIAGLTSFTTLFGTITLTGGNFLARYDETGTALMAQHHTTVSEFKHALGANGDHYIYGDHTGAVFDMNGGANIFPALMNGYEGFLARYNSALDYRWMRRLGLHGSAFDAAGSVITDAVGNVYSAGYFFTTAIICGDTLRAPIGANHIWLNKRDANGNCVWTTHIPCSETTGLNQLNTPASLALNAAGDLYFTGSFFGTIDFGAAQLASAGMQDIFLAKYDANGNCLWAIREGGSGGDGGASISIGANGDVLLAGSYAGNANIAGNAFTSRAPAMVSWRSTMPTAQGSGQSPMAVRHGTMGAM
ncbi:MAG: hypothetical protein IPL52_10095 [Flavobacteriales bacterium]|nr:hypothetical protein [Flavobacteriales bacterium]